MLNNICQCQLENMFFCFVLFECLHNLHNAVDDDDTLTLWFGILFEIRKGESGVS